MSNPISSRSTLGIATHASQEPGDQTRVARLGALVFTGIACCLAGGRMKITRRDMLCIRWAGRHPVMCLGFRVISEMHKSRTKSSEVSYRRAGSLMKPPGSRQRQLTRL